MKITIIIPSYPEPQTDGTVKPRPCVPSWNELLGLGEWQRRKLKLRIQSAFLSALSASAGDSSTRTTCPQNTLSTAAATLASYLVTSRELSKSKKVTQRKPEGGEAECTEVAITYPDEYINTIKGGPAHE